MEQLLQQNTETKTYSIDDPNYYFLIDKKYYEQFLEGKATFSDFLSFETLRHLNDSHNEEELDFQTFIKQYMVLNLEEYKELVIKHFSMDVFRDNGDEILFFDKIHDELIDSDISSTRHNFESRLLVFEPSREVRKNLKLNKEDIPFLALEYCYYDFYGEFRDVDLYEAKKYRKTKTSYKRK